MLEFACPKCNEVVKANDDQAGEAILCPKCENQIKVPGSAKGPAKPDDEWSVFDEDEKFIEESVAKKTETAYKTPEDDYEPLVDNDEEAAKKEEQEERAAVAETLIRTKSFEFDGGPSASSEMTVEEKMEQEERFKELVNELPEDSPLRPKNWDRDATETPGTIKLDNQPKGTLRAPCHVCDSVTFVGVEKAGTEIVCSDCGSSIQVPTAVESSEGEERRKQGWQSWAQKESPKEKEKKQIAEELFIAAENEEEYGLAPPPENLLTPTTPPVEEEDEASETAVESSRQARAPGTTVDKSETDTSALFEEMQSEKDVKFVRHPWTQHVFGILGDPGFILRAMSAVAIMLIGFSIYHFAKGWTNHELQGMVYLGKFIQMWAFPFIPIGILTICWVGQQVLNATIVGAKQLPDLQGMALMEWLSNCLFVAIGFLLCSFPGVFLGLLAWTQFTEWEGFWAVPAFGTFTAMLFSPLLILSAMFNRSPFKIVSKEINESIKKKSDYWIEFYGFALVVSIITSALWTLGMMESWLTTLVMLVCIMLGFGIYFRALGRLMGSIVTKFKKSRDENDSD